MRARVERVLGRVFQEGESPVSVIRALLRHLHRLHVLAARLAAGPAIDDVMRARTPADLLQAGRQLPAPARAVDARRGCGRSSTASPRPNST